MLDEYVPLDLITSHPFFSTLPHRVQEQIAVCASRVKFQPGDVLLQEGQPANTFYVIGFGQVALTSNAADGQIITLQSLHDGDVLGWSWLFPPYRWHFDATATTLVRAIAFDAAGVRELCERDPEVGFHLMRRFASVMLDRLQTSRRRLLEEKQ